MHHSGGCRDSDGWLYKFRHKVRANTSVAVVANSRLRKLLRTARLESDLCSRTDVRGRIYSSPALCHRQYRARKDPGAFMTSAGGNGRTTNADAVNSPVGHVFQAPLSRRPAHPLMNLWKKRQKNLRTGSSQQGGKEYARTKFVWRQ